MGRMKLMQLIANAFINTMGITKPTPLTEKRATWFIVAMLAAVVLAVATIAVLALRLAYHPK